MEELMRRVRRIEKLTDRMSQGQFETKKIAEKVIAGAQIGSISELLQEDTKKNWIYWEEKILQLYIKHIY